MANPGVEILRTRVLIIGAGPAGLTAAWELAEAGVREVTVLEATRVVGGLSQISSARIWVARPAPGTFAAQKMGSARPAARMRARAAGSPLDRLSTLA